MCFLSWEKEDEGVEYGVSPCLHVYNSLRGSNLSRGQTLVQCLMIFCFDVLSRHSCPQRPSQQLLYCDPSLATETPLCTPPTAKSDAICLLHFRWVKQNCNIQRQMWTILSFTTFGKLRLLLICLSKTLCKATVNLQICSDWSSGGDVQATWADERLVITKHMVLVLNSQLLSLFYHGLPLISLKASLPCNLKQRPHACDSKQTRPLLNAQISAWELFVSRVLLIFLCYVSQQPGDDSHTEISRCFESFCQLQWCQALVEACSKLKTNNTPCHA